MARRGLVLALLVVGGSVLGAVVTARLAREGAKAAEPGVIARTHLTSTDPRVAPAFAALTRQGLGASLDLLDRAAAEDSAVLRDGHQLAHALGRLAVEQRGADASVIAECRPSFASGCFHGVVEALVEARGRVDMVELRRMCGAAGSEERPGPVYECIHGVGHGMLGSVGDLETALRDCDSLEPALDAWCRDGVFTEGLGLVLVEGSGGHAPGPASHHEGMEHAGHAGAADSHAQQLAIDPADPYSPWDRFDGRHGSACCVFRDL